MNRYIYLLCFIGIVLGGCSKSTLPIYPAKWAKDWPDEAALTREDSTSHVFYEAQRDETNLYLHISTKNTASQMKILRYGLTIWLEQSGQKKTQSGFNFPVAAPDSVAGQGFGQRQGGFGGGRRNRGEGNGSDNKGERPQRSPEEMQKMMLNRLYNHYNKRTKELVQIGFDGNKKKTYVLGQDVCDIQVDLEIEGNELHYFAVIPLKKIFSNAKYSGDMLSIGIVSGYMEIDPENPMATGGAASGNGGENNGRRAFLMQMMQQMTTPIEIWFRSDLKAAKKQH